ncbi:MAG: type II secretion system protein M [Pelosinus sp.]|nr:type II secretion system protein M [Pelosinus sp.]
MSINLKSLMSKYNSSSPRERILLLALAGVVAVAGAYWLTTIPDDTSNSAGNPPASTTVAKPQPAKVMNNMPQLAMTQEGMRNPFLPPAEFQQFDVQGMPANEKLSQPGNGPANVPSQQWRSTTPNRTKDYTNLDALLRGTGKTPDTRIQDGRPGLVGIVEGAGKRLAIIQYGGDSRSYGIYERVGPYQVTSISSSSVILSGPAGRTVMAVGR